MDEQLVLNSHRLIDKKENNDKSRYIRALWVMAAEEQRLSAMVSDPLVRLSLQVAALSVAA